MITLFLLGLGYTNVYFWSQYIYRNKVFQVQEETWLDYQKVQWDILCESVYLEEAVFWNLEIIFSSDKMGYGKVGVDFSVYPSFAESKYWLHKLLFLADIPSWETVFAELPSYFNSD